MLENSDSQKDAFRPCCSQWDRTFVQIMIKIHLLGISEFKAYEKVWEDRTKRCDIPAVVRERECEELCKVWCQDILARPALRSGSCLAILCVNSVPNIRLRAVVLSTRSISGWSLVLPISPSDRVHGSHNLIIKGDVAVKTSNTEWNLIRVQSAVSLTQQCQYMAE